MMKEIALLIVELHDGSSQHAEPGARQYQADAAPSAITQKMPLHYHIVQKKKKKKTGGKNSSNTKKVLQY